MHGLEVNEKDKEVMMKSRGCPRCRNINGPDAGFCVRCGAVLDQSEGIQLEARKEECMESRKQTDQVMNLLMKDSES